MTQATGGPPCALEGAGGWQFRAHVSPNDGLVLDESSFKGRGFTEQVSVPYLEGIYRYGKAAGLVSKIELTPTRDQAHASLPGQPIVGSTLVPGSFKCEAAGTDIYVKAAYVVDDFVAETATPGPLTVTQEYRFRGIDNDPCEPNLEFKCARFWPTLSHLYAGDPACNPDRSPTCGKFTGLRTVQRLAFRPDGVLNGAIEAYRDFPPNVDQDPGVINTKGSDGSMQYEDVYEAIRNGGTGSWDSIHQSPTGVASGPSYLSPGCGESVHMHWHWSRITYLRKFKAFTDGKPQILEHSKQSADFGIARLVDTEAERDPVVNGWRSLIDKKKSEASQLRGYTPVVLWEMTSFDKDDATFPLLDSDKKRDDYYKHGGNGAILFGEYSRFPALPRAPANLRTTGRTASSVTLAWDPSDRASGYRVYRNDVLTRQVSATNTIIGGLRDNTTYKFTVSAFNAAGESAPSSAITVQTLPTWKFAFVSQQVYDEVGADLDLGHVRPGERGRVVIKVRNIGSATWTRDGPNPVLLGIWPESRTSSPLEQDWFRPNRPARLNETEVKRGDIGTFEFSIKAPSEGLVGPGEQRFNLVAEGLTWFDDQGIRIRFNVIPVVGMAAPPDGGGSWLMAADGGVFTYGNAKFFGSAANDRLRRPVVGMAAHPEGSGYWLATSDGSVRNFIAEDRQTGAIPRPNRTDWQLNGAAQLNGDDLVLTPAENDTAGTAFYKTPIKADGLRARFTAVMEGGSGADGLTLAFLDPANAATTDVGGIGGLLGFAGLAGTAVALDTWPNLNDPSDNFVGVAQGTKTTGYNDEGPLWVATTTEVPRLIGSQHQVEVTYAGGHLKVRIDGNQVLDTAVELPANVLVGFTGATGNATNVHTVRDVTITPGETGPPRVA